MFKVPEKSRKSLPGLESNVLDGNNGMFVFKIDGVYIRCVASDGDGWEHVSVSVSVKRTPDWAEMCAVKDLFWSKDDCVIQYHPPESEYVNNRAFCLHLWRKAGQNFETPPSIMVGSKELGTMVK